MKGIFRIIIKLTEVYITSIQSSYFYTNYISKWAPPLNDASVIGIVLFIIIVYVIKGIADAVRNQIYKNRSKLLRAERKAQEAKRRDELTIKMLQENANANANFGNEIHKERSSKSIYTSKDIEDYKRISEAIKERKKD